MNIVRVKIDVTPLIGPASGIHQVTKHLTEALADVKDIQVGGYLLTARHPRIQTTIPIRRSHLPAKLAHLLWQNEKRWLDRFLIGPADVVHGINFTAPPSPRSIVTIQDMSPILHPQWCQPEVVAKKRPLEAAIKAGAMIHTSSNAVAEEVRDQFTVSKDQICVIPYGIRLDVAHSPPIVDHSSPIVDHSHAIVDHSHAIVDHSPASKQTYETEAERNLNRPPEQQIGSAIAEANETEIGRKIADLKRFVLVLGTVERRKNVVAVAKAMRSLPNDVGLVIAGPAGNAEKTLAPHLSDPRIVRLEAVSEAEKWQLIRRASVLVYPTHYEGFGLPPLEALSVRTPIVSTAVGALPELIGDLVQLIPPGDEEAILDRLHEALKDPKPFPNEILERLANLTWQSTAQQMANLYRKVSAR